MARAETGVDKVKKCIGREEREGETIRKRRDTKCHEREKRLDTTTDL